MILASTDRRAADHWPEQRGREGEKTEVEVRCLRNFNGEPIGQSDSSEGDSPGGAVGHGEGRRQPTGQSHQAAVQMHPRVVRMPYSSSSTAVAGSGFPQDVHRQPRKQPRG
ncbi:hypothetical protein J437_LFUL013692 [Ladona fulva]|uniref:Uncharacterized protein n=1 Tax=Ladona fulva TaxID=123851 RepID=A0A8K0KIP6_LADFU|nr:hypothetical protein J437_LFUL013692 [Ladona fulva]